METTNVSTRVDGWTEVTLMAHIVALIAEHDRRYQQRFEDQANASARALAAHDRLRSEGSLRLEQRFEAQQVAVDNALATVELLRRELELRNEQRFAAQEKAVEVALAVVNREFHEHLSQYQQETRIAQEAAERAIAAALAATEKAIEKQERATELAITKQEIATDKRFEGVNEFRAQLADQATSFARKAEVDARLESLTEKVETAVAQLTSNVTSLDRRTSESFTGLGSRLDLIKGNTQGQSEHRTEARAQLSTANMVLGLVIAVVTIVGFIITANALTGSAP